MGSLRNVRKKCQIQGGHLSAERKDGTERTKKPVSDKDDDDGGNNKNKVKINVLNTGFLIFSKFLGFLFVLSFQ